MNERTNKRTKERTTDKKKESIEETEQNCTYESPELTHNTKTYANATTLT